MVTEYEALGSYDPPPPPVAAAAGGEKCDRGGACDQRGGLQYVRHA